MRVKDFNVPLGISHLHLCLVVIIKDGTKLLFMHFNQLIIKSRNDSKSLELYLLLTPGDILISDAAVGVLSCYFRLNVSGFWGDKTWEGWS